MAPQLDGPFSLLEEFKAWRGAELGDGWREYLNREEISALVQATRDTAARGMQLNRVCANDIVPPGLKTRLLGLADTLAHGRGFFVLRRLPVERMSESEVAVAFAGLAAALGRALPREGASDILTRLNGGSKTNTRFVFDCDGADIAGYLCLRASRVGGEMRLVSAPALHNEMACRRPDLLSELYGRREAGAEIGVRPLFTPANGRLETSLDASTAAALAGFADRNPQRDRRHEALDCLAGLVDDLALDVEFEPGDLLFASLRQVFVARAAHEDYWEVGKGRTLLRLALNASVSVRADEIDRGAQAAA